MHNDEQRQTEGTAVHSGGASCFAATGASIFFGLLIVGLFIKPIAFGIEESTLLMRYAVYSVALFVLFATCEAEPSHLRPSLLRPLCGPAAAACTASAYLQIFGIPVLWLICGIAWFKIGCCMASCWGASREEQEMIVSFQLFSFARVVIAMSMPILIALLVNDALLFMAPTHTASFW